MPYVNPNRSFSSSSSSDAFAPAVHPLPSNDSDDGSARHRPVLANGMVGRRLLPWPRPTPAAAPRELPVTPQPAPAPQPPAIAVEEGHGEGHHNGFLPYVIRSQIKTLKRVAGWTLYAIADYLSQPYTTVHRIANEVATPAAAIHGLRQFGTPVANRIIEYVTSGAEGRRATYPQIRERLELACSVNTIRRRLNERGYFKRVARQAPFLDADGLDLRPQFGQWCLDHLDNGRSFMFGNGAAFGRGGSSKFLVIRRVDEAFDPDCLGPRYRRIKTQHIFGLISGNRKSKVVFWETAWGNITARGMAEHVLPEIKRFWSECVDAEAEEAAAGIRRPNDWMPDENHLTFGTPPPGIVDEFGTPTPLVDEDVGGVESPLDDALPLLCLDGAAVHKAAAFRGALDRAGITHTLDVWPANSPDLNPIENVWALMKYRLHHRYPHPSSNAVLRQQILEVWEALTAAEIAKITGSFRTRCEKVMARNGRHTGY